MEGVAGSGGAYTGPHGRAKNPMGGERTYGKGGVKPKGSET